MIGLWKEMEQTPILSPSTCSMHIREVCDEARMYITSLFEGTLVPSWQDYFVPHYQQFRSDAKMLRMK